MTKLVGIKATVTMSRTLYIEVQDNDTEEEILKKANEEIIPPHNALHMANIALKRMNIQIDKLDLTDWEISKYNIEQIKESDNN